MPPASAPRAGVTPEASRDRSSGTLAKQMNRRAEILNELVRYELPSAPLMQELSALGWDWLGDTPLVTIKKKDILRIIDRFLGGDISAEQLQEWAENLEVREDVAFDEVDEKLLDNVFFRIATPFINEPLTVESVSRLKTELLENK